MPYLFFSGGAGGSNLASGWQDAGRFLVGFSAVMVSWAATPPQLRPLRASQALACCQLKQAAVVV